MALSASVVAERLTARCPPQLAELSDEELLPHLLSRNPAAVAVFMRRHNRRLYRITRSILRNEPEAEDALQETYLRAFASLSEFRGQSRLSTWLTRIAINEALARLRRRRPSLELDVVDAEFPSVEAAMRQSHAQHTDPEAAVARAEIRGVLERAIDNLPGPFRVVFVMRAIEEISTEETAEALGLRVETVKTRLHRARRLLRTALEHQFAANLTDAFPFEGARCQRLLDAILARSGFESSDPP